MSNAIWMPWLGGALGLLCLWGALFAARRQRLIDNLPTCKTTGVFIGLVELKGSAESERPLVSYLAQAACVWYAWNVQEHWSRTVTETYTDKDGKTHTRTRTESGWTQVAAGGEVQPFYLKDDEGAVQVVPQGAEVEPVTVFSATVGRGDPLYYGKGPAGAVANSGHRRQFTETAIPLHAPIYVVGTARERADVVAAEVAADSASPMFLISTRSEQQVHRSFAVRFWITGILGLVLWVGSWIAADRETWRPPAPQAETPAEMPAEFTPETSPEDSTELSPEAPDTSAESSPETAESSPEAAEEPSSETSVAPLHHASHAPPVEWIDDAPRRLLPWCAGMAGAYLAVTILCWIAMAYNSLMDLRQRVRQAWSNVDVQLKRRADLIPNLVRAVTGLRAHEREVQTALAALRTQATATAPGEPGPDPSGCAPALVALVESYPALRSDAAFMKLHEELVATEQRLALARDYFNNSATAYNTRLETYPDALVARLGGLRPQPLIGAEAFERAPVTVQLAS